MVKNKQKLARRLSIGEEIGNAVTHGVMAFLLLGVYPFIAVLAYQKGGWLQMSAVSIFIVSLFLMFLLSTLYHAMAYDTKHKVVFRILDHIGIYFAIAGSYTPVALVIVGGFWGNVIMIIQWSMVLIGILYKSIAKSSIPTLSVAIYLVMGWIAILFMPVIFNVAQPMFLGLIGLGGLLYTGGVFFYGSKFPYAHFVWHLFINFAAISHFIAIVFFL
jgi:hemolysin III